MNASAVVHDTIRLKQTFHASAAAVFNAWANPMARQIWAPPSKDQGIVFERADFRPGGVDVARCGPKGNLYFKVEVQYLKIVPDALIMFTEKVSKDDVLLSTALICAVLSPVDEGSELELIMQLTSLCGSDIIKGYQLGWTSALGNLARHLRPTA